MLIKRSGNSKRYELHSYAWGDRSNRFNEVISLSEGVKSVVDTLSEV